MHSKKKDKDKILFMIIVTIILCSFQLAMFILPGPMSLQRVDPTWDDDTVHFSDNVNTPQLLDAHVNPDLGTNTTLFNFSVVYVDLDGEMPVSINITIDGATFNMTAVDMLDLNVIDGKNYSYSTMLPWGLHQYQIKCFDGLFPNETLIATSPAVDPFPLCFGQNVTIFEDDFEGPSRFTQGGSGPALWHVTNSSSAWSDPYHSPTHAAWCGSELTGTYDNDMAVYYDSPSIDLVGVTCPRLEFHHWMETMAGTDTCEIYITSNNFTNFELLYLNSGSVSPWERVTFDINSYAGYDAVQVRFLFRSNAASTLRGWYIDDVKILGEKGVFLVTPFNGSTWKNGNINFTWDSSPFPVGQINYLIQISNSSSFATSLFENSSIPERSGSTSVVMFVNSSNGIYYWRVKATYMGCSSEWSRIRWFTLQHNDYTPVLNGSANPQTGDILTSFNLDVAYTDADNSIPTYVQAFFDGIYYVMNKVNLSDSDFTDGCLYRVSLSGLSVGSYAYQFLASDGLFLSSITSHRNFPRRGSPLVRART
jgi:hypothetical protein